MNPPTAEERADFIRKKCGLNHSGALLVAQHIREAEAAARMEGAKDAFNSCEGLSGLVEAWRDDAAARRSDEMLNLLVADIYDECANELESLIRARSKGGAT